MTFRVCVGTLRLPTGAAKVNALGFTTSVEMPDGLILMGMETAEYPLPAVGVRVRVPEVPANTNEGFAVTVKLVFVVVVPETITAGSKFWDKGAVKLTGVPLVTRTDCEEVCVPVNVNAEGLTVKGVPAV